MSELDARAIAAALARARSRRGSALGRARSSREHRLDERRRPRAPRAPARRTGPRSSRTRRPQGRGRGGHAWHSPPGENLYLSLVLRPRIPAAAVAPISLAVGLAVAAVVERALLAAARRPPR